ncbi:hypothetical protein KIN20_008799 [Parelaphostrongylus tenuis]|uniref:L-2-hydroxyglutarate dehydrogenase, mitochondrial n=1 Tax=Parelaphostrongylus tenuis TaxID=148309 RepID=A0AAD5QMX1_PARTN|nr:hypothetical protein KIN20_008799 [Parelaphostrongylus tenuis]
MPNIGATWPSGCNACHGARGAELYPPTLSASQQQRPMERHSQAIPEIARRLAQPVFYDVQEARNMFSHTTRQGRCLSLLRSNFRKVSSAPACNEPPQEFDVVVAGGGIVGSATARQLKIEYPNLKVCMVEKENRLAAHQSGHNSGVLHAGIYYKPGTLKAKLCVEEPHELPQLDILYDRSQKNGCRDIQIIDGSRIKEFEPHCKGLKAIWSPHTGIVDWGEVTKAFAADFERKGGTIYLNFPVNDISQSPNPSFPIAIHSTGQYSRLYTRYLITCCGLQSDRVAELTGCDSDPKIVPFRGEYLLLKPEKRYLVRTNIYPVPVPGLPFLGVHFTPRMNGDVLLGPNAVLAWKREGYSYFSISLPDLYESLTYRGTHKLMFKYFKYGMTELYRGVWINSQVKQLQRFVPELKFSDVTRGPTGVRAQAVDLDGSLVDDFVFDSGDGDLSERVLHVRNAPSPAATSSLAIAKMIASEAKTRFAL